MNVGGLWDLTSVFFGTHCSFEKNVNSCQHIKLEWLKMSSFWPLQKNQQFQAVSMARTAWTKKRPPYWVGMSSPFAEALTYPSTHLQHLVSGSRGVAALLQRNDNALILRARSESQCDPGALHYPRIQFSLLHGSPRSMDRAFD